MEGMEEEHDVFDSLDKTRDEPPHSVIRLLLFFGRLAFSRYHTKNGGLRVKIESDEGWNC
jgi:hypothetical protein